MVGVLKVMVEGRYGKRAKTLADVKADLKELLGQDFDMKELEQGCKQAGVKIIKK